MFGYTADEMVGQSITRLFPADRLDEEPKILDRLRRGQRVDHFETVRVRKDGRPIDVSVTISPVKDAGGNVIGVSKVARDVTAIKRALAEREQLLRREQAARAEAERVGRMKDEFLSTLSHELRTPLNAILGWANLLRGVDPAAPPGDDLREGLETIERNARAQAQLIDELLDTSRIVNGKLRLDLRAIDLGGVIDAAVESLRPAADAKRILLTKLLDPAAGPIYADPNRLQQVLWNLLSNAVKFTPPGGRVQVLLQRVNFHLEITVADTGPGVDREFLPRLFDRFSQAETSTTRHHGGLGLGLAIVKAIVELHGGTVAASSPGAGHGSTFVVSLPVAITTPRGPDAVHPRAEPPTAAAAAADLPRLDGYRVLVVDDEPDARALIERILRRCGADVATAGGADEAFDLLRRGPPDLILSDVGMPGQDGYQFLRRVRALSREQGGDTPAVAITAFARSEDRRRALTAGFQMHLPKPVEPAELLAVVASHYNTHRRATGRA
jgi:PAS domain S-box-containing protein